MRIVQPNERRFCSDCKKYGHYRRDCKKKTSSSLSASSSRKVHPYQGKPPISNMSKFKACLSDSSDEDDEQNYHISQAEKEALLGEDNDSNSMDYGDSKDIVVVEEKTNSKTAKDHIDSAKSSNQHHQPQTTSELDLELKRQKQKTQILKDELRVSHMKRDLILSEITFCTRATDINNLKIQS